VSRSAFGALALLLPWPCTVLGQVTTAQYDNARTSAYTTETQLTPRTVNPATFGKIHVLARTKEHGRYVQRRWRRPFRSAARESTRRAAPDGRPRDHRMGFVVRHRSLPRLDHGVRRADVGARRCPQHDAGWQRRRDLAGDAGLAADRQGRIYAVTGNGTFSAGTSQHLDFGDTVLQLTLGAHGFVVSDYFTPGNEKTLEETDGDLGEVRHARRHQPRLALGLATCVAGQDAQVWSIEPR